MRHSSTILLFLFLVLTSSGQPVEHKGFIGISGAVSLPLGKFSSKSPETDQAGYAKTGFGGAISTQINIRNYIGFAGMIGYHANPYDTESFRRNYVASHAGTEYNITSDDYTMMNLLAGAFVAIPQGILDINLKGFIGVSVCTLPFTRSTSSTGVPADPVYMVETEKDRATAFTYGGGVNLLFNAGDRLAFYVDASYIQANPSFNAVEVRLFEDGELVALSGIDLEQPFQFFSLGAGIAVLF